MNENFSLIEDNKKYLLNVIENDVDFIDSLKAQNCPTVLYGMGNGADKILNYLLKNELEVSGVFASDDFVRNQNFRGYTVHKFSHFENLYKKLNIIVAFGSNNTELISKIQNFSIKHNVFIPEFSVVGDVPFTKLSAIQNIDKISELYTILADQKSKTLLKNLLRLKITASPEFLWQLASPREEIFTEIINFSENETFIDGGAYRGDTIEEFLNCTDNKFSKIVGFEPDRRTFKHLSNKFFNINNIELVNSALSNISSEIHISDNKGRGTRISENTNSKNTVKLTTIDKINMNVSYIKLDVEGEELNAISGGILTIKKYKPKMQIALYHRADDFYEIPLYIHSINEDYKLYLRQHLHFPAWDLNLIAI